MYKRQLSKLLKENNKEPLSNKYSISQFGILDDRSLIHERIEERLKVILSNGLEEEAKMLEQNMILQKIIQYESLSTTNKFLNT